MLWAFALALTAAKGRADDATPTGIDSVEARSTENTTAAMDAQAMDPEAVDAEWVDAESIDNELVDTESGEAADFDRQLADLREQVQMLQLRLTDIQDADSTEARGELLQENLASLHNLVAAINESWLGLYHQLQVLPSEENDNDNEAMETPPEGAEMGNPGENVELSGNIDEDNNQVVSDEPASAPEDELGMNAGEDDADQAMDEANQEANEDTDATMAEDSDAADEE